MTYIITSILMALVLNEAIKGKQKRFARFGIAVLFGNMVLFNFGVYNELVSNLILNQLDNIEINYLTYFFMYALIFSIAFFLGSFIEPKLRGKNGAYSKIAVFLAVASLMLGNQTFNYFIELTLAKSSASTIVQTYERYGNIDYQILTNSQIDQVFRMAKKRYQFDWPNNHSRDALLVASQHFTNEFGY